MLCEVFQKYILERHQTNSCALLPWLCPVALSLERHQTNSCALLPWLCPVASLLPSQVFWK